MHLRARGVIGLLILPAALWPGGCTPAPPPEAVLAGTWLVTTPSSGQLSQLLLTFDGNGNLTTISYQVGNNAVITATSPNASTSVNGDNVSISATFLNNTLTFDGTFNSDKTIATGTLTTQITVGPIVISINNGPAIMTKQ